MKGFLSNRYRLQTFPHVLILGNDDVVPFCRLRRGEDAEIIHSVYSDSFYVDLTEGLDHTPAVAIGRLPDTGPSSGPSLADLLKRTERDRDELILLDDQYGVTSNAWIKAGRATFKPLDPSLRTLVSSPPFGVVLDRLVRMRLSETSMKQRAVLYFNLHGKKADSTWYGERRRSLLGSWLKKSEFARALDANFIRNSYPNDSVVISTACYTTDVVNRTSVDNIALAFLERGCRAVIGPSSIAFSSLFRHGTTGLSGIHLLYYSMVQNLRAGKSVGEALRLAKLLFAADSVYDDINVLGSNLLGDPCWVFDRP